jgi:hypothetical protein
MLNGALMNPKSTTPLYSSKKSFVRRHYLINDQQLLIQCRDNLSKFQNHSDPSIFIVFNQVTYLYVPTDFDGIEIAVNESASKDCECITFSLKCMETNLTYIVTAGYMNIFEMAYLSNRFPMDANEKFCGWTKRDNFRHVISYPSNCPSVLFSD